MVCVVTSQVEKYAFRVILRSYRSYLSYKHTRSPDAFNSTQQVHSRQQSKKPKGRDRQDVTEIQTPQAGTLQQPMLISGHTHASPEPRPTGLRKHTASIQELSVICNCSSSIHYHRCFRGPMLQVSKLVSPHKPDSLELQPTPRQALTTPIPTPSHANSRSQIPSHSPQAPQTHLLLHAHKASFPYRQPSLAYYCSRPKHILPASIYNLLDILDPVTWVLQPPP
jgi:hypothetical protein